MFHRTFFDSIIDKHQHMHFFTFKTVLVLNVNNHHHHHHHHQSFMELSHLLTRSGLTYPEVSLTVYHDFLKCQFQC